MGLIDKVVQTEEYFDDLLASGNCFLEWLCFGSLHYEISLEILRKMFGIPSSWSLTSVYDFACSGFVFPLTGPVLEYVSVEQL